MKVSFRFTRPVKPGVYFTDVDLPRALQVRDVIFNPPATIVFWEDGMKTIVKCSKDDAYDPERGFELAFLKRVLGGGAANDIVGRALLILGATPGAISARVACGIVQVQ